MLMSAVTQAATLQDANAAFERGDYRAALIDYEWLARSGDKFAQYRTGMMNYFGLGTSKDMEVAYGWMATAAEEQIATLKKFQLLIWNEMSIAQRDSGTDLALTNELTSGTEVLDAKTRRERRKAQLDDCSGSRIGADCTNVQSFSLSFINRASDSKFSIPHAMTEKEAAEFERENSPAVMGDFEKFDR